MHAGSAGDVRAGYIYCDAHKHAEDHACDYDMRSQGRAELARSLPKPTRHAGRDFHRLESTDQ